jgi:hypothetical protein
VTRFRAGSSPNQSEATLPLRSLKRPISNIQCYQSEHHSYARIEYACCVVIETQIVISKMMLRITSDLINQRMNRSGNQAQELGFSSQRGVYFQRIAAFNNGVKWLQPGSGRERKINTQRPEYPLGFQMTKIFAARFSMDLVTDRI